MKKVYDSLHGFIYLNPIEQILIRSRPLMRLQAIFQLGVAYLVYPGATHTRFEHSLGTMLIASKIYERLISQGGGGWLPHIDSYEYRYYKKIIRLAALCHDLGHLPFSHSGETLLLGEEGHEKWTMKIIRSEELKHVWQALRQELSEEASDNQKDIETDIIKLSIGPESLHAIDPDMTFTPLERILSQIITADLFGADRIDYLLRDSKATGLAYGNIDYMQLLESLCIQNDPQSNNPILGIDENGVESCEALLLARYFMHQRLCQYPSVKSYSFHAARALQSFFEEKKALQSPSHYIKMNDHILLADIHEASYDPAHPRHFDAMRLIKQKPRFKAYRMPEEIEKSDVIAIQNELDIPSHKIGWDFEPREKDSFQLSFLPFKTSDTLSYNWVFIDPEYKTSFLNRLGWNEKQITED